MAAHNKQFAIDAEQQGSAFVADRWALGGDRCVQEDRTVGNDNTVEWQRLRPSTAAEPAARSLRQGDGAGA